MIAPPAHAPLPPPDPFVEIVAAVPSVDDYLTLYRAVGEPQGWDLRYRLSREELAACLASPSNLLVLVKQGVATLGFIEFELRDGEAELLHFGLVPQAQGRRLGSWLLDTGLRAAWARGIRRIHLHTDDCDHPAARGTYLKAGFTVTSDQLEDPTDL